MYRIDGCYFLARSAALTGEPFSLLHTLARKETRHFPTLRVARGRVRGETRVSESVLSACRTTARCIGQCAAQRRARVDSMTKRVGHRALLVAILWLSTMLSSLTFADDNRKLPKIGELWFPEPDIVAPWRDAFRQGLTELGYVNGRNVTLVSRYANGDARKIPKLVDELIAEKVDVMFVGPRAIQEARRATKTIPIVSAGFSDPIAEGVAVSLARPGGNFTGISWQSVDASSKRIQLVLEILPKLNRVALLFDSSDKVALVEVQGTRAAAATINCAVREFGVLDGADFDRVFAAIKNDAPPALIITHSPLMVQNHERILRFVADNKLAAITESSDFTEKGALLSFGPHPYKGFKRAAYYVDRILKGAKPGDLPIEQPTVFELVVNLKTAKTLGIKIPESIMLRADEVIR